MTGDWLKSIREVLQRARADGRLLVIEGVPWMVYEMSASQFDRRHSPSLVFESDYAMRRVRGYPAHWRDLSDDDLFALSWSR